MKVQIAKATAEGETVMIEVSGKDIHDWDSRVRPVLDKVDARMLEMNMRLLNGFKTLEQFPAEYRGPIKQIIQALHGHRPDALSVVAVPEAGEGQS